ncbi:Kinesin-9, partial [Aduncisulcus paluster]
MNINVVTRIRPRGSNPAQKLSGNPDEYFSVDKYDMSLQLKLPLKADIDESVLYRPEAESQHRKRDFKFNFSHILDEESTQEDVFDKLCLKPLNNVIEGYNATIFAFGQTGSGKTYTITGHPSDYTKRGLMPRALEYIFDKLDAMKCETEVTISYLQIYQGVGYDLLGVDAREFEEKRRSVTLDDLPRVKQLEDSDKQINLRGLSTKRAQNVGEALEILFNGDCNRIVVATPQNNASSRSHCVFTLHLRTRQEGSDVVRHSKLNFVDLAGSERVHRTMADGTILQEAKYINGSLFSLEQVIHKLSAKSRLSRRGNKKAAKKIHVPYRTNLLTMVLRDSLGGNSVTSMLATISVEPNNIPETISTCTFAMNVAEIKNNAMVNEDLDPRLVIKRLKRENAQLKAEIVQMREALAGNGNIFVTENQELKAEIAQLKQEISKLRIQSAGSPGTETNIEQQRDSVKPDSSTSPGASYEELERLKRLVRQRDTEIDILTEMLDEQGGAMGTVKSGSHTRRKSDERVSVVDVYDIDKRYRVSQGDKYRDSRDTEEEYDSYEREEKRETKRPIISKPERKEYIPEEEQYRDVEIAQPSSSDFAYLSNTNPLSLSPSILDDRKALFDAFYTGYYDKEAIERTRTMLKERYAQAKDLARVVKEMRDVLEHHRHILLAIPSEDGQMAASEAEQSASRQYISLNKPKYNDSVAKLKKLKSEVEHIQAILDRGKKQIQTHFSQWLEYCAESLAEREEQEEEKRLRIQQEHDRAIMMRGADIGRRESSTWSGDTSESARSSVGSSADSSGKYERKTVGSSTYSGKRGADEDKRKPSRSTWEQYTTRAEDVYKGREYPKRTHSGTGGQRTSMYEADSLARSGHFSSPTSARDAGYESPPKYKPYVKSSSHSVSSRSVSTGDEKLDSEI